MRAFHTKCQCHFVRIGGRCIAAGKLVLVYGCGHDSELSILDKATEAAHEVLALGATFQKHKWRFLFAYLMLVQNDDIVTKVSKLESLHLRGDNVGIVLLAEDAEVQHEHGIIPVNSGQGVIAAFIDIDDVVAIRH